MKNNELSNDDKLFGNDLRTSTRDIQSPEDERERKQVVALQQMNLCRNLDELYDVVFQIDDKCFIKGNISIFKQRSEYFRAMFSQQNGFKEASGKVRHHWAQALFCCVRL